MSVNEIWNDTDGPRGPWEGEWRRQFEAFMEACKRRMQREDEEFDKTPEGRLRKLLEYLCLVLMLIFAGWGAFLLARLVF